MTYSIVARNPDTGEFGIAVASRFFACGSLVPHVCANAAFASQAFVNPLWGVEGLERLAKGETAETLLADLIDRDVGQASRQAHIISPNGEISQHTGADCVPWAGHAKAQNVSVAGNMLAGPEVVAQTLAAWIAHPDLPFADRFLTAMEAGERAGGDIRGKQAASLLIHAGQPYPFIDFRVDDHNDPLSELRRLKAVAEERYLVFRTALPTVQNFSGMIDRTPLDKAIAQNEKERAQKGVVSLSRATSSS